ncbi:hypothetical protein SEVIR_1G217400v4 [Setaria viridis]|uniref:Glycine-rich protein n=2 Tax=Setaria TaxID=4554 RepID=A0A368PPX7_SETIT|nr:glycine-rich cell wall structural protein-like [Setaria italica]XP_034605496.1 glycine-rich cell wall structural protein-like [Setaria viridis]RCV07060.1 hypothetical protein SETIT_1G213700v2 [Setaria italica]TKW40006.1 hypothetical protein SEVIR_1G217400v2 [Setaria viridis]
MASKVLLVFALLVAAAFLVASAKEQAQPTGEENKAGVQDYHGGGGYPGGGYPGGGGGYPGRGGGGYPGRGGGGYPGHGGGYCRWRCCSRGYYGGCRCCSHPDEIPEPMYRPEAVEVHN